MRMRIKGVVLFLIFAVSIFTGSKTYAADKAGGVETLNFLSTPAMASRRGISTALGQIFNHISNDFYETLTEKQKDELLVCFFNRSLEWDALTVPDKMSQEQFVLENCFIGETGGKDKYAMYFTPTQYKLERESWQGSFGGIGIQIKKTEDSDPVQGALILDVFSNGPAGRGGILKAGDVIVSAGDDLSEMKPFGGLSIGTIVEVLRGRIDSIVYLKVKRSGELLPTVVVARGEVQIDTVSKHEIKDGIGYIKLISFDERDFVKTELIPAIFTFKASFDSQKKCRLIVDVRNNPGGFLSEVFKSVALFSPGKDAIILTSRTRNGSTYDEEYASTSGRGPLAGCNTVVLVDEHSASAAEIFPGALQRWGSKVFGETEHTYGKGSINQIFDLFDGGAFKLTIGRYFIGDKAIEGVGVKADVVVPRSENPGEDPLLDRAFEYLRMQ